MTFREKLAKEHPECVDESFDGGCKSCPHVYGYETRDESDKFCRSRCVKCWDREIPETKEIEKPTKIADAVADVYHRLIDRGIPEGTATYMTQDLINRGYFDKCE